MQIELHQFPYSHFNEKARWALDFKGLQHQRIDYMPGPHMPAIKKLSGQTQTPVLSIDGDVVAGSAAIIERLELVAPSPALYPNDPAEKEQALQLQADFDAVLGPMARRALFSEMVDESAYFVRMFAANKSWPVRLAYRASFPFAKGLIKKGNGVISRAAVDEAFAKTAEMLDFVAETVKKSGYLVGDRFSVADLTAAALLAPVVNPPNSPMSRPEPMPDCVLRFLERWVDHPASAWVRQIYADHRNSQS